jgi:hypothetical protein
MKPSRLITLPVPKSPVRRDHAGCRPRCEHVAPQPQQSETVLLPPRRPVGAHAAALGWWAGPYVFALYSW